MSKVDDLIIISNQLIQESVNIRDSSWVNLPGYANDSCQLYLGQSNSVWDSSAAPYRVTINRIQNAVISNVAVQTSDPAKVEFKPRETGEKPIFYFNTKIQTPEAQQISGTLDPIYTHPNELGDVEPLPDDVAMMVMQQIKLSQARAQQAKVASLQSGAPTVSPEPLPDDLLIAVDDELAAAAMQKVFDIKWDEANLDFYVTENQLYNTLLGAQHMAYEWDEDEQRPNVWNPMWMLVHVDPTRTDISKCQWAVMDFIMSADEAKARNPQIDPQAIDALASKSPYVPGITGQTLPMWYIQTSFQREMVVIRYMWRRFQPFPLSAEEAMEAGHVEVGLPDPPELDPAPNLLSRIASGASRIFGGLINDPDEQADGTVGEEAIGSGAESGLPGGATEPKPSVLRHKKSGQVVGSILDDGGYAPNAQHEMWPVRYGLEQSTMIVGGAGGLVIKSGECEFIDIPLPHNVNIPIPGTPWGQGEPTRLKGLQVALDRVLSDCVAQQHNLAFPVQVVSETTNKAMSKELKDAYIKPANMIVVPDSIIAAAGGADKLITLLNPASVSAATVDLVRLLLELLDKETNMADALQGQAPAGRSGEAIDFLQTAAKGVIAYKGMRAEKMIKYLAKLIRSDIVRRITPQQLAEICPKYPVQVWMHLNRRWKVAEEDMSVEVTSGSGSAKARKEQATMAKFAAGLIPLSTAQKEMNYDPEILANDQARQQQMDAASQQPQQPPDGAVPSGG